jgi:hypothetical protein
MRKKIDIDEDILDSFISLIEENEDYVLYDYHGKENQILIQSHLVYIIENFLNNKLPSFSENKREILKQYIREAFELSDNTVVINKNSNIFIKIIDDTVQTKVPEDEKETIKNRFNGIKEEELKSFYDEFFAQEENQNFFFEIAQEFVERHLLKETISNEEYEKNVFAYIHTITLEKLTEIYDNEDGFFFGFAGYIFRIHFNEVFAYIAELILDEIAKMNHNIISFLNYYSQDILVMQGVKYKIPHIEAENGLRWTLPSMLSIVKIYTKTKISIAKMLQEQSTIQEKIEKFYLNRLSPIKFNELLLSKKTTLEMEIEHTIHALNVLNDKFDISKNETEKASLKVEIQQKQKSLQKLKKAKDTTLGQLIKRNKINQYLLLKKELDKLQREIKREEKVLQINEESYNSIKSALAKALISKKRSLSL